MMNKTILLAVAMIVISAASYAQVSDTDYREKLQFGLKAGANYSNVYDAEGEEFSADGKFGFVTGAFLGIPIGKYLGVHPEILFSQKGFKGSGRFLGSDYTFIRTLNYIDVPVMLALKPVENLTLLAGPQYTFLVKRKDEFTSSNLSVSDQEEFENDNIRKNTMGIAGGFDVNMDQLVLGARVAWDLQNNHGDGTSSTPRYRNVWYQLTLGYRF